MLTSLALLALVQDAPRGTPVEVVLQDGLRFRAQDGSFEARLGGLFMGHARAVFDRPDDDGAPTRSVPDSAFVRQARLELDGRVRQDWGFKVQAEFGTGRIDQSSGAPPSSVSGTLRDAFVEWRRWSEFQLRFGQFFVPLSQEDVTSTRFIDFVERSPVNRLLPGREIGLQASGTLLDDVLRYAVMALNGASLLNDQGRSVADREDEKELSALVQVTPFRNSDPELLRGLRLGLGASVGSVDSIGGAAFDLVSTELSILWWDSDAAAPPAFDGRRERIVPQLSWAAGPFSLRAEYLLRRDELADGAAESELESAGGYLAVTYLVTGEEKRPETRVEPLGSWGAVELALRASRTTLDNAADAGLGAASGNAEEIRSLTAGVNWWVTRSVRVSANVVSERYDEALDFDGRREDRLVGVLFRGQIDF